MLSQHPALGLVRPAKDLSGFQHLEKPVTSKKPLKDYRKVYDIIVITQSLEDHKGKSYFLLFYFFKFRFFRACPRRILSGESLCLCVKFFLFLTFICVNISEIRVNI